MAIKNDRRTLLIGVVFVSLVAFSLDQEDDKTKPTYLAREPLRINRIYQIIVKEDRP